MYKVDSTAIRHAMVDNGYLTITSLSKATGISRNYLAQLLNGKQNPTSKIIGRLVDVLNIQNKDIGNIFFNDKLA